MPLTLAIPGENTDSLAKRWAEEVGRRIHPEEDNRLVLGLAVEGEGRGVVSVLALSGVALGRPSLRPLDGRNLLGLLDGFGRLGHLRGLHCLDSLSGLLRLVSLGAGLLVRIILGLLVEVEGRRVIGVPALG